MKTTIKKLVGIFSLVCVVVFTSCSNDDEAGTSQQALSDVTQEFQSKVAQMDVPSSMSSSTNTYAQQATNYFTGIKNLGQSFSSLLTVPQGATTSYTSNNGLGRSASANSTTYTWSSGGYTVTYIITEESDRYTFEYNIDGGPVNGKLMDGYQLKDGSYAEFKMYSQGAVVNTFKFWVDGDIVTGEMETQAYIIRSESNLSDNSGNVKLYNGSSLEVEYNWNADGSGTYTNYLTNQTFTW